MARLDGVAAEEMIASIRRSAERAGAWLAARLDEFRRQCLDAEA